MTLNSTYDKDNYLTTRTYAGQGKEMRVEFANNLEGWNTNQVRFADIARATRVGTSVYEYGVSVKFVEEAHAKAQRREE